MKFHVVIMWSETTHWFLIIKSYVICSLIAQCIFSYCSILFLKCNTVSSLQFAFIIPQVKCWQALCWKQSQTATDAGWEYYVYIAWMLGDGVQPLWKPISGKPNT